jgi:phosphatidate cytidylyltransferase
MKRVLTAVLLIPVVLLIVFKAPLWLFIPIVGLFVVLGLREYLSIVEAAGFKPFRWMSYILGILPVSALFCGVILLMMFPSKQISADTPYESDLLPIWIAVCMIAPVVFGTMLVFRKDLQGGLASASSAVLGILYVAMPLSLLIDLRANPFQRFLVVFILFSVWAGDIAAYYVGKNFGRHKLAPIVSPNKTWEGAVASALASVIVAGLVFYFQNQITDLFSGAHGMWRDNFKDPPILKIPWVHVIALGILTNVAAQFGDLFESALKRGAGVKDSGTLLPGHGGLLDRIDALLFAIPMVMFYATCWNYLIS